MTVKFYRCKVCGKIIAMVKETAVPTICCGQEMYELIPGTTDGALEKHVPVVTRKGNIVEVKVGSVEHPMTEEHYIQFIEVFCDDKILRKYLEPNQKPEFLIKLNGDVKYAREYCNIHGLWKSN